MTKKSGRTRQRTNNRRDELIRNELRQMTKVGVSLRQENDIAVIDIFHEN